MGNDIEIRVRVANQTATGLAAVNASLNRLRDEARDAGRSLDGLATRAAATAVALRSLKDAAQDASRALRSLNQASRTTDTRLAGLSDRSRTLRRDSDDLDGSLRSLTTTMGGLRGRLGTISTAGGSAGGGMQRLKAAALSLAPALIPIAAAAVPIAAGLGAAGVAVGVFGAAIAGQLVAVKGAADAQKKYEDAVKKHGQASEQAAQAEAEYLSQVKQLDPASRRTAAALGVLKDQYKDWSKSLAGDTMPVATKGLAVFGALLPRLTPMVRGASGELDRFMTILAGGINSSGFDHFMESFAKFSTGALSKANDGLVRFMRTMSGGAGSSQLTEFMEYAHRVGPQVGETLMNLAQAMVHLVAAASETGVTMLTLVNSFAKLVNAIPTEALSTLLQFVVVFKAVKMAAAGLGATSGGIAAFGASLTAMRAASTAAGGGMAGLAAAFGTLSRAAKVAVIGAGIGILVIALTKLSSIGKQAPPDVDKLTTSLGKLGNGGKVAGEAARVFGKDLGGLADNLRTLSRPSNLDKTQQFLTSLVGMDSTPVKEAKENLDGADKALANLVKGGKADIAAAAVERLSKGMQKNGMSSKELRSQLDDYRAALADQALEQQLAAQAMGLFGEQSLAVGEKLNAQKASADGLRQSLEALNDANRSALGGMIGFEASIDAAAKAAKENAGSLNMVNGQLDVNSPKAQAAATALNDLASKTKDAALSARENGQSWESVNAIYERGRSQLIKNAQAMGLTKSEARQLAGQIMKIPSKSSHKIEMRTEDAIAGLNRVAAAMKKTKSKSVTVKALTSDAKSELERLGFTVKRLKDGRFKVTAATGSAKSAIAAVQRARDALKSKSITLTARDRASAAARAIQAAINKIRGKTVTITTVHQSLGVEGTAGRNARNYNAHGGLLRLASGGQTQQHFPAGGQVQGPGTPTSDSISATFPSGAEAQVSNTEYVVQASAVRKYGVAFMEALNAGKLRLAKGLARGGMTQSMKDARNTLRDSFDISHFGRKAGYSRTPFEKALGAPSDMAALTSALNAARGNIKRATSGSTERRLLRALDSAGKGLIKYEKQLTKVNASLEKAKSKLDDLKGAASQLRDSVKSNVLSSANVTKGAGSDKTITVASIMGGLTESRDKATAFASALKGLRSKGLSKSMIQQIGEAGIDGGGLDTAGALLGASSSEISSLNRLQSQIASAASSAGKTTADAVYASAIKAQTAVVHKLQKSQDRLEKSMSRLAKALEKAISKAIGKKAAGGIVGAAASGGVRGGMTWVGEHEPELLDLPVGSRVRSGPDSRRIAAGAGGGVSRVELELRSSGSEVDDFLLMILRRAIRQRGSDVQFVLTGRRTP
ncbi:phage tail protein [Streptomyces sp. NPDC005496]|uniref:phage tail protein n=1 Tax=unclassified Streptomyces TaxID=2593676 RepID=UPI0033B217C2